MVDFKKLMAARKASGGTEIVKWDEKFANYAKAASAKHQQALGQGNWINTRGGILTVKQNKVTGNKLDCVIVADTYENAFYVGKFDLDDPKPPVCFAFGDDVNTMVPHDASSKKQHHECKTCPQNAFGTSETGRGKACKNIVRMALVQIADLKKDAEKVEPAFLKTSVTSRSIFARYSKDIEDNVHRPLWGVVTRITLVQDSDTQFKFEFSLEQELDDVKLFPTLEKLCETQSVELLKPYQPAVEGAAKKNGTAAKKPNKFTKAGKATAKK